MQSQEDSHSALSHRESFLGWAPLATVLTQLEWLEASCSVSLTHTCPLSPWLLLPNPGRKGWVVYPRASRDKATCTWANYKTFLNLTHNYKNVFRCKLTKTHFYILIPLSFFKRERQRERKRKAKILPSFFKPQAFNQTFILIWFYYPTIVDEKTEAQRIKHRFNFWGNGAFLLLLLFNWHITRVTLCQELSK